MGKRLEPNMAKGAARSSNTMEYSDLGMTGTLQTRNRSAWGDLGRRLHRGLWIGLFTMILGTACPAIAWGTPQVSEEYQIKAAFLFNFIKFVDWPKERFSSDKEPLVVGVVGKDPFGENLDQLAQKPVKDRPMVIKRFGATSPDGDPVHAQLDQIRQCHVIFISPLEKKANRRLIEALSNAAILTVGDTEGFLDDGGMINFLVEDRKVRFEIGLAKVRSAKLDVRSQLLRLAKRVDEGK